MVSLTRRQKVGHLIANFRPLNIEQPDNTSKNTFDNNTDNQQNNTDTDNSNEQQVVLYNASSSASNHASSQTPLQARLDLMPLDMVESELKSRRRNTYQEDCSILDFLQNPGGGLTKAQAAAEILNELADQTEQISFDSALVWRYVQLNSLWDTHINPGLRSAEAFLNSLDQNALVRINIVVGTSTDNAKRGSLTLIEKHWGLDWYDKIPVSIRPSPDGLHTCSKRMLGQIAANCKKGHSLTKAIAGWEEAIRRRTDETERKRLKIRSSRTKTLTVEDVATLNKPFRDEDQGRRTHEMFFPELEEDRLELMPTRLDTLPPKSGPSYSKDSRPLKKRRRTTKGEQSDQTDQAKTGQEREADASRVVSKDDKWENKKVRDHLIRQPVENASSDTPSKPTTTCDGEGVAAILVDLVGTLNLFCDKDKTSQCCDRCYPLLLKILESYKEHVQPHVNSLCQNEQHLLNGVDIPSSIVKGGSASSLQGKRRRDGTVGSRLSSPLFVNEDASQSEDQSEDDISDIE